MRPNNTIKAYGMTLVECDAPTAALRRLQMYMRKTMKSRLTPQAAMFATLEMDPSCPSLGMPHVGLTPTGAEIEGIEGLLSVDGESRWSYRTMVQRAVPLNATQINHEPGDRRDYTTDSSEYPCTEPGNRQSAWLEMTGRSRTMS
jgi:hypothetical protein